MNAPSICVGHMPRASENALLRASASSICTDGRTDERHEDGCLRNEKASSSSTRAHVQIFDNLIIDNRALRAGKETA